MSTSPFAIAADHVTKRYRRGPRDVTALDDLSLHVPQGEFLSIMGPSGSGKSTLLNLLGGIDTASQGTIVVAGVSMAGLGEDARTELRRTRLGIVFQFFNLLPSISALDNVALPLSARKVQCAGRISPKGVIRHLPRSRARGPRAC